MRRITLITTGGTMEKEYDERRGVLVNRGSVVDRMLRRLRLADVSIVPMELMHKDSLELTDADRALIVSAVRTALSNNAGETDDDRCRDHPGARRSGRRRRLQGDHADR